MAIKIFFILSLFSVAGVIGARYVMERREYLEQAETEAAYLQNQKAEAVVQQFLEEGCIEYYDGCNWCHAVFSEYGDLNTEVSCTAMFCGVVAKEPYCTQWGTAKERGESEGESS